MLLTPFIEGRTKPSIPNKSKYPPCMSHSRMAIIAAKGVCVCVKFVVLVRATWYVGGPVWHCMILIPVR